VCFTGSTPVGYHQSSGAAELHADQLGSDDGYEAQPSTISSAVTVCSSTDHAEHLHRAKVELTSCYLITRRVAVAPRGRARAQTIERR
jgi:hypothetical protein